MPRSPWYGNQNLRRWAWICLALSFLVHLLLLCLIQFVYEPLTAPPPSHLVRLVPTSSSSFAEAFPSLAPTRLPLPTFAPDGAAGPGQGPAFGMEGGVQGEATGPAAAGVEGLPLGEASVGSSRGEKAAVFPLPPLPSVDLDALLVAKLRQEIAEREQFARFEMPDADTTDEKSQRRTRARQVVERAIAAMGGREALARIREMKARVWMRALEDVVVTYSGTRVWHVELIPMAPYPFPVAIWQYGPAGFTDTPIHKPPLTPDNPYLTRNPSQSRRRYGSQFETRWAFLPPAKRTLREQGESKRWHFIEHFLGEHVDLVYVGAERFGETMVDAIQVEDYRYGGHSEAFFEQQTGLLLATRDGLIAAEQKWYTGTHRQFPPVWTTLYLNYRPVEGVLLPHTLQRSGPECPECAKSVVTRTAESAVFLNIGVNGAEPSLATPIVVDDE